MIRPLRGRALVRRHASETGEHQTQGGIIVPATVAENPRKHHIHRGTIIALGEPAYQYPGVERPWLCKVGDEVLFVLAVALEKVRSHELDGQDVVWAAQEEIQGVFEPDADTIPPSKPAWWEPGYDDQADMTTPDEPAGP